MRTAPCGPRRRRLALLVVGEDLQLDREVDLAHVDLVGDGEHGRGEVEDAADAGGDHPVADVLRGRGGGGDHSDRDAVLVDDHVELVEAADLHAGHDLAGAVGVGVEQGDRAEAAGAEAGVVGERVAQVADADDHDRPVLGQADLAGDLVAQVLHVVPDAAGAVGAEVREVLAQLGRVDPRRTRELLAGAGRGATVREGVERPQVHRKARHGCLGNAGSRHCSVSTSVAPGTLAIPCQSGGSSVTVRVCELGNKPSPAGGYHMWDPSPLRGLRRGVTCGWREVAERSVVVCPSYVMNDASVASEQPQVTSRAPDDNHERPLAGGQERARRRRDSSTRQKSWRLPSTRVTGISSA